MMEQLEGLDRIRYVLGLKIRDSYKMAVIKQIAREVKINWDVMK